VIHAPDIVVLTGAGISAESGLPTFRGSDGLWEGHKLEEVATPRAFASRPDLVQRFYNLRRRSLLDPSVAPNPAHLALARLERALPGRVLVVTQNIDDLHERAGSRAVLHMHGELLKARCTDCEAVLPWRQDIETASVCPSCAASGRLRPHVVWFGEMPLWLPEIEAALSCCRLFVAVGTSGVVYPAAGFVETVRAAGAARTIEINLEPSAVRSAFAEHRQGKAGLLLPALVDELLEGGSAKG
jgi:NAD-dependent deacetylase